MLRRIIISRASSSPIHPFSPSAPLHGHSIHPFSTSCHPSYANPERLALFEPAALIHDMRNYRSDGTRFGFNYANFEFWGNCVKLVKDAYPWWTWKHWRARAAARLAFDFVQGPGGWKAWQDCHERNLALVASRT